MDLLNHINKGLTYENYIIRVEDDLEAERENEDPKEIVQYYALGLQRMNRVYKTFELTPVQEKRVKETANNFNSSDIAIARLNNSLLSSSETTNYKEKLIINTLVKSYLLFAKKINNLRYQIFDFSGKVIKTGFVYNSKLDLNGLKKGIYLIKVAHETAKFTKE